MFGKNPVTAPNYRSDGHLRVKAVFHTLQGEGPRSGQPAVFVRLAGCNLRCWFCDTDFEGGELLSPDALVERVYREGPRTGLVVLTGGEPLAQQVLPFIEQVTRPGWVVQVETAGTCYVPPWGDLSMEALHRKRRLEIVCSPKTPNLHRQLIALIDAYKYVIRATEVDPTDGLPSSSTQKKGKGQKLFRPPAHAPHHPVYLMPMDEQDPDLNAVNRDVAVMACLLHGYRLTLQIHKQIGVP